jgi:hypothetical protein
MTAPVTPTTDATTVIRSAGDLAMDDTKSENVVVVIRDCIYILQFFFFSSSRKMESTLSVRVKDVLECGDRDSIMRRYMSFLEEGRDMSEACGERITEVLDVDGVSLMDALKHLALLMSLLQVGVKYDHADKIVLKNMPSGIESAWNTLKSKIPALRDKNIYMEFR